MEPPSSGSLGEGGPVAGIVGDEDVGKAAAGELVTWLNNTSPNHAAVLPGSSTAPAEKYEITC